MKGIIYIYNHPIIRIITNEPTLTRKIVLVDDNKDLAEITSLLLKMSGFEVAFCHDGTGGIELIEKMRPDIVILDINIP